MKKKLNDLITNIFFFFAIALLISGFFIYDKITFVSEITFCSSNPTESALIFLQNFCEVPILKRFVLVLNTRLLVMILAYIAILYTIIFILKKFGWRDEEDFKL